MLSLLLHLMTDVKIVYQLHVGHQLLIVTIYFYLLLYIQQFDVLMQLPTFYHMGKNDKYLQHVDDQEDEEGVPVAHEVGRVQVQPHGVHVRDLVERRERGTEAAAGGDGLDGATLCTGCRYSQAELGAESRAPQQFLPQGVHGGPEPRLLVELLQRRVLRHPLLDGLLAPQVRHEHHR